VVSGEKAILMKVSAVVPHWNRRDLLETFFENIRKQTRPFDEVIIVDNGSSDDSAEFAERCGARVLRLERNFGFARAVNRGIELARGDWIAILNNDVTLDPLWLETLLGIEDDVWFATGKILSMRNPKMIDAAFDEISRGACAYRCGSGRENSAFWSEPRPIRFASMTAALFRREIFRTELLDERFESYLEDVDFAIRCAVKGRSGIYVPKAVAYHAGSATLGAWNSDTVFRISRNQVILAAKYFSRLPRWPILAGQLLWGLVALRHGRSFAWLRGKFAGLRVAREIRGDVFADEQNKLRTLFEASERTIFEVQQQTGFDWYWRAYFWLLRR
jgi:GT2 family glycosyltransferase